MVSSYDLPKLVSIRPPRIFKFSSLEFTSKSLIQQNFSYAKKFQLCRNRICWSLMRPRSPNSVPHIEYGPVLRFN